MKGSRFILTILATIFIAGVVFYRNSTEPKALASYSEPERFEGRQMTIDYTILVGTSLREEDKYIIEKTISEVFNEIDHIYNKWNPVSELSLLNNLPAQVRAPLSQKLEAFLEFTDKMVSLSEGRFDPTIEPLQKVWKSSLEQGFEPSIQDINTVLPAIGWDKVHWGNGVFYKEHDLVQIDLGGIAKGYCIDLLVERLTALGYTDLLVNWGGEIRTAGVHPTGRKWQVAINGLGADQSSRIVDSIELKDAAIAGSGDYLQYWVVNTEEGQKAYFHIIDPFQKKPLQIHPGSIASTSVVATSCAEADALATALMTFSSKAEALAWGESVKLKNPQIAMWIVTRKSA
ncbi:MAG: hypothetical protein K0S74_279 [Chlamydiales bacterium]|jgi:thiamine biosynthesis lipoprotein|nr:hypothetical protein [Chlamydiales bacterium]